MKRRPPPDPKSPRKSPPSLLPSLPLRALRPAPPNDIRARRAGMAAAALVSDALLLGRARPRGRAALPPVRASARIVTRAALLAPPRVSHAARARASTRAFTPSPSATSARRTARLARRVPTATPRRPLPSRRTASSSPRRRRRRRRVRRTTPTPIPTPPPLRIAPRRRSRTSACRSLCARRSRRSGSRNRRCPSARLSLTSSRAATSRFSRTREAGRRWRTSFPSSRGS